MLLLNINNGNNSLSVIHSKLTLLIFSFFFELYSKRQVKYSAKRILFRYVLLKKNFAYYTEISESYSDLSLFRVSR